MPQSCHAPRGHDSCCDLGNVHLQLWEPPASPPSPQLAFLDAHGGGVHHLGFEVPDGDRAEADARALAVTARGKRADGTGFAYFDTRAGGGVTLEIRKTPPAP